MLIFQFNARKAIEVILWVAHQDKGQVGLHRFFKALFYADLYHVNKYGRPVLGDTYVAMDYGPVLARTYDILKKEPIEVEALDDLPFDLKGNTAILPKRAANLDYLSESDIEALQIGWDYVKDKTFDQLKDLTHAHAAYLRAVQKNGPGTRPPMEYDDFLVPNAKEKYREFFERAPGLKI